MRKLIICLFLYTAYNLCTAYNLNAQPGYVIVTKNINDFSLNEIEKSKAFSYDYYRCTYIIDSTSDLSKLNNLRSLRQVKLIVNIKVLPKELTALSDSLKEITIYCGVNLSDIVGLRQLKNLESISIMHYLGTSIPDLHQLTELRSFSIWGDSHKRDNLKHINGINNCKSLKYLEVNYISMDTLDLDMTRMNLESLRISCQYLTNVDAISGAKSLKQLQLHLAKIDNLPKHMQNMTNLEYIDLADMDKLKDIKNLKRMKNLRELFISDVSSLSEIPLSFNSNLTVKTVRVNFLHNEKFTIEGLKQVRKLRSLSLINVPASFLFPENFYITNDLEDVEFVQSGPNKLKNQAILRKLPNLKRLQL